MNVVDYFKVFNKQLPPWACSLIVLHSNDFNGEEHEGPPPYNDWRRLMHPPDCCRFDVRSYTVRTNPTSDVGRVSSRSDRAALPSRGGALPRL